MMQQQPGKSGAAPAPQGKAGSPQLAQIAPILAQIMQSQAKGGSAQPGKSGAPQSPQGPTAGTPTAQGHMGSVMGPMSNPNAGGFAGYQSPPSSAQPPKAF